MGKHQNRAAIVAHQSVSFSGPLPTPNHLEQYERILPGAAERILKAGGAAICPGNSDQELKDLLQKHPRGYVSKHPTFLGVVDGIHWLATGHPMPQEKIENIASQLN